MQTKSFNTLTIESISNIGTLTQLSIAISFNDDESGKLLGRLKLRAEAHGNSLPQGINAAIDNLIQGIFYTEEQYYKDVAPNTCLGRQINSIEADFDCIDVVELLKFKIQLKNWQIPI